MSKYSLLTCGICSQKSNVFIVTILDRDEYFDYIIHMKRWFIKSGQSGIAYIPLLMLALFLSSITVVSFHHHDCSEDSDNCTACRLQQSFSSLTIVSTTSVVILQKPLSDSIPILNEQATDPSQKLVCSSHAPPQYT